MSLARELARKLPRIRKIKLCRDVEEEDWWICLYEEKGPYLELQQYTWNAYQDRPQPFLVLERIARSGLQKHLTRVSPGMKCQVLDPPTAQGWLAQIQKAGRSPANRAASPSRAAPENETGLHFRTTEPVIETPNGPHGRSKESIAQRSGVARSGSANQLQDNDMKSRPTMRRESSTKAAVDKSRPPDPKITKEKAERSGATHYANSPERDRLLPRIALESDGDPRFRHAYAPPQPSGESLASRPKRLQPSFKAASAPRHPQNLSSISKTQPQGSFVTPPSGSSQQTPLPSAGVSRPAAPVISNRDSQPRRPTYFVFAYGSKMNHTDFLAWLDVNGYDSSMVVSVEPAVVSDYDLVWSFYSASRGGGAVNAEPRKSSRIWGLLIEIEDPLLDAFDRREGHPNVYSRGEHRVAVQRLADGKIVFAWLYRAKPNRGERRDVWPTVEYKQKILEAALFWKFPQEYVQQIESWKTR